MPEIDPRITVDHEKKIIRLVEGSVWESYSEMVNAMVEAWEQETDVPLNVTVVEPE